MRPKEGKCLPAVILNRGEQCLQPCWFLVHGVRARQSQHKAEGTRHCSGEQRVQELDILLNPNNPSSQSPSQGGTHHVGHIGRGSTLQQSLDDGQVSHEGSHMQGGQARL